jgi:hypothetical protein
MQGGLPIIVDGEVIGAVGASFDTPAHDVQIAQAGLGGGSSLTSMARGAGTQRLPKAGSAICCR